MPVNSSGGRRWAKDKGGFDVDGSDTLSQLRQSGKGKGDADGVSDSLSELLISGAAGESYRTSGTSASPKEEDEDSTSSEELPEPPRKQKLTFMNEEERALYSDEVFVEEPGIKRVLASDPIPQGFNREGSAPLDVDRTGGIPGDPCTICDSPDHWRGGCPYLFSYPPDGPKINTTDYDLICHCGSTEIIPGRQSCSRCVPNRGLRVRRRGIPPLLEFNSVTSGPYPEYKPVRGF